MVRTISFSFTRLLDVGYGRICYEPYNGEPHYLYNIQIRSICVCIIINNTIII
jgi:hypothetical protein